MSNNQKRETLADIVAELRFGPIPPHRRDNELLRGYADRIEAAAAAMREALESVENWCINKLGSSRKQITVEGLLEIVQKALSAPPRNCDRMGVDDAFSAFSFMCDNTNCSDCPYKRHNRFGDRELCAMLFLYDNGNGGKEGGAE